MGVHYHKRNIPTDGLIFISDPANKLSYIGSGTACKNVVTPTETGTLVNGTGFGNNAYTFDGVNDYIDFGNINNFQANQTFSISAWVKRLDNTGFVWICSKEEPAVNSHGYLFDIRSNLTGTDKNRLQFTVIEKPTGGAFQLDIRSNGTIVNNKWHLLTVTYDGTALASGTKLYIDKTLQTNIVVSDTLQPTDDITTTDPFHIGAQRAFSTGVLQFTADIENGDTYCYNRVITQAEVEQIYESQKMKYE